MFSPLHQQLLLCQEKLVNFEGVGCCFAGGALRCLNTGLRVSEHPLFFRTVIPLAVPGRRSRRATTPGERVFPRKFCQPFSAALQKHLCILGPVIPCRQPRSWQCPGGFFILRRRIFQEQGVCRGLGAGRDTANPTARISGSIFSPSNLLQELLYPREQGK